MSEQLAGGDARSPVSPPAIPADCQDCGACCHGFGPLYLPVNGDDHQRLGDPGIPVTHFIGNRCYLRLVHGRCSALDESTLGRFSCSLYTTRPEPCRDLLRGSAECIAVLVRGLPPRDLT